MKRIISAIILCAVCFAAFVSCSPASDLIVETTEKPSGIIGVTPEVEGEKFKDYVIHSNDYAFYLGEYYYFYSEYLSEFVASYTEAERAEMGFQDNVSLKNQSLKDGSQTWYAFFRNMTENYMTDVLLVCEEAAKVSDSYIKAGSEYASLWKSMLTQEAKNNGYTFVEYIYAMFGGNVAAQNYLNAVQMEYIYQTYSQTKYEELYDALTEQEINAYIEKMDSDKKDIEVSRNVMYILVDDGREKAETICSQFNAGERTAEAFTALAGEYANGTVVNCTSDASDDDITKWLFAEGRQIGDCAVIDLEGDGIYVMFYFEDGKPNYYLDACTELTQKAMENWLTELRSKYKIVKDEEKLDSLNA